MVSSGGLAISTQLGLQEELKMTERLVAFKEFVY